MDSTGQALSLMWCCLLRPAAQETRGLPSFSTPRHKRDYAGTRRPRQYLFVDDVRAKTLNQRKAFHVDASRIARLPLTNEYFPGLESENVSVISRDPAFVSIIERRLEELLSANFEIRRVDHASPARRSLDPEPE
jgi:hypothetical protein